MLTSLLATLVIVAIQVLSHKLTERKFKELTRKLDITSANSGTAASHSAKAAASANESLALLTPAVAQLPKTRARRNKSAGIGETEVND